MMRENELSFYLFHNLTSFQLAFSQFKNMDYFKIYERLKLSKENASNYAQSPNVWAESMIWRPDPLLYS